MGFANVINACRKCPKIIICRVQGKAVGGGVGMACAGDYCFATKFSSIKLSELAVGIGPFVVGPAVERKSGLSAYSTLSINATKWFSAEWAREKGIYSEIFDSNNEMDKEIDLLAKELLKSNPEAIKKLKEVFWSGTSHWDKLLEERAEYSGQLVLSDFTKQAIADSKQNKWQKIKEILEKAYRLIYTARSLSSIYEENKEITSKYVHATQGS